MSEEAKEIDVKNATVSEVGVAFAADLVDLESGKEWPTPDTSRRDSAWQNLASEHGDYSDQIAGLRQALTKGYKREPHAGSVGMFFTLMEDPMSASLLKYLTISKHPKLDPNDSHGLRATADGIANDLGFEHIHSEGFHSLRVNNIVEGVLSGSVKLTHEDK